MQNSLLVFGTENFNESLNEIEEHLKFSLIYYKKSSFSFSIFTCRFVYYSSICIISN